MGRRAAIKTPAIIRAGFDYQDLVGLEVLIRHFRDPHLYSWVELEAEDAAVQSLDDIIALRQDGSVEFTQVKFTVDADTYPLDWDWLLRRAKRGTSMLAKWAAAFARARSHGPIAGAELRTNRRPSAAFATYLDGSLVKLDRLPPALRATVEEECGGADRASDFFGVFAFVSALPDLAKLEHRLRDQLVPDDTDETGWLRLRDEVRRWATYRGSPPPDGKIMRDHLVQLITRKRPQPIRQDFAIPEHYAPPSALFDNVLRLRVENGTTPLTVIWGSPGRGKSTYLSYLTASLQATKNVVLRHHYFLPTDPAGNRTSFFEITNSLLHQLAAQRRDLFEDGGDDPNAFRRTLENAAKLLKGENSKLYLIVDGLDHVWRDTERIDQLNYLFAALLPLPDNVVLLVGTQKVPDAQLPKPLIAQASSSNWVEIPPMDEPATHHWVRHQDADRPFRLAHEGKSRTEEIDAIAGALFRISAGHPLHLIYSIESLRLSGQALTGELVARLPSCPDGDIRKYYQRLWSSLSEGARELLHGLAGSEFYWPCSGVRSCFGNQHEIVFLMEPRASGLSPFHGSLFAWVRDLDGHDDVYRAALPKIIAWLSDEAPLYWRWGWLWLTKAKLGDPTDLLAGCTRDWAVTSLAHGWSEVQIEKVVAAAEAAAFAQDNLALTVELRAVRNRVTNARRFQARSFGLFRAIGIAANGNDQQADNLIDNPFELDDDEWTQLVLYAVPGKKAAIIEAAMAELWRRVEAWIVLRHKPGQDFEQLSAALVQCTARGGPEGLARLLRFLSGYRDPRPHHARLVRALGEAGNIVALKDLRRTLSGKKHAEARRRAQEQMLRAAWRRGGDPDQLLGRFRLFSPLLAARLVLRTPGARPRLDLPPAPDDIAKRRYRGEKSPGLEQFFSDYFWARIVSLKIGDATIGYSDLDRSGLGWAQMALTILDVAAQKIIDRTAQSDFATLFLEIGEVAPIGFSNSREQDYFQYIAFRNAIVQMAIDLHLLGSEERRNWQIPRDTFEIARASAHWVDEVWLNANAADAVPHLSSDAAAPLLEELAAKFASQISDFSERNENWTQLAALACLYRVGDTQRWVIRAADCLLGYGNHKDLSAMEMLEAVDFVSSADRTPAVGWMRAVAPIIQEITEFTDGDETDHVRSSLIDTIAIAMPENLGAMHRYHLHRNEWRYADECIESAIDLLDFETPETHALARSLIDPKRLERMETRGTECTAARALYVDQLTYLGGAPVENTDRFSSDDWSEREPKSVINPMRYTPARLEELIGDIASADVGYMARPDLLRRWLDHWASKHRAVEALAAINTYLNSHESVWPIEEMLDHAFEVSFAVEGRDRAYAWLVRAHVARYGWSRFHSSRKSVEARLELAARHYPDRWQDYIRDTSAQTDSRRRSGLWFAIGSEYLVRFLVLVGQIGEATNVTDALVRTFVEETRDQPIGTVAWLP